MDIRIASNEKDSEAASYIYAMSWKSAYEGIFSEQLLADIPLDFWVNSFNGNYATHRFEVALMRVGNEDIGAGAYGLSRDYSDFDMGEITSIYFLDKAWGKGYAKMLMDFMISRLKDKGCKRIHLWVLEENTRAQSFYEKYGFCRTGNEKAISFKGENAIDVEYIIERSPY